MAIESLNQFIVSTATRHPQWSTNPPAYDKQISRYNPDYVNPSRWFIGASALDALIDHNKKEQVDFVFAPVGPNPVIKPTMEAFLTIDVFDPAISSPVGSALKMPDEVVAYHWKIVQNGGSHQETQVKDRSFSPQMMAQAVFEVRELGEYTISLFVSLKLGGTKSNQKTIKLRDFLIVSIGDSLAAGEGVPDDPGKAHPNAPHPSDPMLTIDHVKRCENTTFTMFSQDKLGGGPIVMEVMPNWQEPKAHRSYLSGPSRAAMLLETNRESPGDMVTFLSFARSGSTIFDGLITPHKNDSIDVGQIDEIARTIGGRRIDALVITIGVNDVGFNDTLTDLVKGDFSIFNIGNDDENRNEIFAEVDRRLDELPNSFIALDAVIKSKLRDSVTQIFITEYPVALFDRKTDANGVVDVGPGCGIFSGPDLDIDKEDAREIKEHAILLNEKIREAANNHKWTFITKISEGFESHGYCSGEDNSFFVFAEDSCKQQGDFDGTMHPNHKGHQVIAEIIANRLNRSVINPKIGGKPKDDSSQPGRAV
jgi:lysophospholipase L1-like esterase